MAWKHNEVHITFKEIPKKKLQNNQIQHLKRCFLHISRTPFTFSFSDENVDVAVK